MRPFCPAQGRLSYLRIRASILQRPTASSATTSASSASPSCTLFCSRIGRPSQQRSHTSGQCQKPWQKQWQKPWEKQGKNPGQESGQESGQKSWQKKSGPGQQGSRGQQGWQWAVPPHRGQAPLLAAAQATAALGTAAFVKLSENEEASGDTGEMRMLQASRKEIAKKVDEDDRGFSRLRHKVVYFLDLYVWEPLCTGFRFIHLALIFVPVILAVPAIWIGRRQRDRNNERAGTLWWYGFLVKGMEWAGPAFIKVRTMWMLNFQARGASFQSEIPKPSVWSGGVSLHGASAPRSQDMLEDPQGVVVRVLSWCVIVGCRDDRNPVPDEMAPSVILVNVGRCVSMLLMFGRMCVAQVDRKSKWKAGTKWLKGGTN